MTKEHLRPFAALMVAVALLVTIAFQSAQGQDACPTKHSDINNCAYCRVVVSWKDETTYHCRLCHDRSRPAG
jgi:hypothetical protein